ncbi:Kynureninase (L-kynurenine hydrolase) [Acarospora aff. strigata]|nr:Kynureninase (L-kynurenine hydrolase) [Acarospora aff. strigata]
MGSRHHLNQIKHGPPLPYNDDSRAHTKEYAQALSAQDPLKDLRAEFIIPTKADLKRKTLTKQADANEPPEPSIYLCGNSLGLQPRRTSEQVQSHLSAWATKGVLGHFFEHDDSTLPPFLHVDDVAAEQMAPIVGALRSEVAVMGTLTSNLHLLMASFYRPDRGRWKVMIEGKAFPSDHYAVESQIRHHGLNPKDSIIIVEPTSPTGTTITTDQILSTIDAHASTLALILLPGIQYYTGQYFDIATITAHAQSKGIIIGWDLAHAVGNVDVQLHDWNVDFAAWCNYKYLNSGPGAIAGLFVHERHGAVDMEKEGRGEEGFRPRLSGWWGGDKSTRFDMDNSTNPPSLRPQIQHSNHPSTRANHHTPTEFIPIPGAAGYQVSNPSALDLTAVLSSLSIFSQTSMSAVRAKSINLTGYLEHLLLTYPLSTSTSTSTSTSSQAPLFIILTPPSPRERGAQLSIRLRPNLLEPVMRELEDHGVVVDERRPDVIRVAPAPLYNSYVDVWEFWKVFSGAVRRAATAAEGGGGREGGEGEDRDEGSGSGSAVMMEGGRGEKGWGGIK